MRNIKGNSINVAYLDGKDSISVQCGEKTWIQDDNYQTSVVLELDEKEITLPFRQAGRKEVSYFHSGIGEGYAITYSDFSAENKLLPLKIQTKIWVETQTNHLYFELIPLTDMEHMRRVNWPAPFLWNENRPEAYTLFPQCQGTMIPSNWPKEFGTLFKEMFFTMGSSMPWIGQVTPEGAYMQIAETPFDCGYGFHHAAGGPTDFHFSWESSLGQIRYRRILRTVFFEKADYNDLCKTYRRYLKDKGLLITLRQKEIANPRIGDLIGAPIIHSCIDFHVKPEALIYKKDDPEANNRFATFAERAAQIRELTKKGLKKGYLHLDGWGIDGYDQQHPDIMPINEKAGGAAAMKDLLTACHEGNILFALHDQYRDYYLDAASYDEENAIHDEKATAPGECTWNGGDQTYLCASLAGKYLERNLRQIEAEDIFIDGMYLDVFTAVNPDECFHPEHTMTRKECMEYRGQCMELLRARGIIASSESGADALMPHMELCHHLPYPADYMEEDLDARGIRVPLWNLVYHDCAIVPWIMKFHEGDPIEDIRVCRAAINGGAVYLDIGASEEEIALAEQMCELQKKVGFKELVRHEYSDDFMTERSFFAGGITVTVNHRDNTYAVTEETK